MTKTWRRMLGICTTFVGALALTVDAKAGGATCGSSSGPDVIVGDITGPSNYSPVGTTEALSLGTTSCNLGNVWLNWFANNNQHPVIGGTLYRYKVEPAGWSRFEQVGRSWLKHGFFALSQTLCCGCSSTDGTHLGVGCSDPYTSSRNGGQGSLGPRYQVNASTGAFTYPPASGTGFSGSVARRLEVDTSDLETTALYFGEAMYVTPDDAAAGNNHNNASWRQINWNGAGSFNFVGATVRQAAALEAWKVQDPAVTIVTVPGAEVSGSSRFMLAYRTTNNGDGTWHYEYALYNMNSDNSARSFTVPVGVGVTLSNVGFHDVDYRNGDGNGNVTYSGTDWPSTESGGAISWSTEAFATNSNANALRWSSTMNFRFDASVAPVAGNVSVGLFKVPGLGPISIPADVPGVGGNLPVSFCWGDGSLPTPCPCVPPNTVPNPSGAPGHGCANSFDLNGAELSVTGTTNPDTIQFTVQVGGNYSAYAIMLKGDAQNANGVQNADGVLCVSGAILRFGAHYAATGGANPGEWTLPNSLMPTPISTLTAQTLGQTAYYQLYYRNAAANFCNPWGANWSNGMELVW